MLAFYDDNGRVCTTCSVYQPWDAFHKLARGQNGRRSRCRTCQSKVSLAYNDANRDEVRRKNREAKRAARAADPALRAREHAANRAWREKNPGYSEEYNRRYYEQNTEKLKAGVRRYLATHVEEAKAWQQNYRARKRSAGALTGEVVRRVRAAAECFYCETPFTAACQPTLDHVIPLCQKGVNEEWNLVACCRSCNSRKKHRNLAQWTPPIGRTRIAEKMATRLAALGVIEVDSA